jgi:3-oxoacyl-[acyl-carrier protein] reductase/pteridine reductase
MNIENKVALVTGGARRVGKVITLMLAAAGANVVINYNQSATAAEKTAAQARTHGVQALTVQCNVASYDQVQAMAGQVKTVFGGLDILVNNADRWETSPFPSEDLGPWHRVTETAINGCYYVSNTFAPLLLAREQGAMVNIVDLSAWEAWPNFTAHAVGKAAILAMTRQFALELAPTVRVNGVAPGPVLPPPDYGPEKMARTAGKTLLNRWGSPEDVAQAVKFLIESDYITGDTIFVDGGQRYGRRKYEHG